MSEKENLSHEYDLKKNEKGEIDWWDYTERILWHLADNEPELAESLLAIEHPILLKEEYILGELRKSLKEKYGRDTYLELDETGKHVVVPEKDED